VCLLFACSCNDPTIIPGDDSTSADYRRHHHDLAHPEDLGAAPPPQTGGGQLRFAVFGDCRPPAQNDTSGYPSAILDGVFAQAQSLGAQFVVGTGDYMFASNSSAVDAQVNLFFASQAHYTSGPVYHTLGNHECSGYTSSNCPNGNETANMQAFMSRFVPAGVSTPYYRVDVATPSGNAKLLFVAANAWSSAQENWLSTQLADATTYTFVVRHEPTGETSAPGVGPSDSLMRSNPLTLALFGHTHEYRHLDANHVISGNAGAPLQSSASFHNYGLLLVDQQSDGSLTVSEIDEASGNVVDSFRLDASGALL
jgi:hypothetical protein